MTYYIVITTKNEKPVKHFINSSWESLEQAKAVACQCSQVGFGGVITQDPSIEALQASVSRIATKLSQRR